MRRSSLFFSSLVSLLLFAGAAASAPCDWRLSGLAATLGTGGAAVASAGMAMKGAGFYTLVHSTSGLTMLGSTAGGASAAGTVGIMGGTGGAIGTVSGILMAPEVIAAGAVVAVGAVGLEGICYFQDDRVTKYRDVLAVLRDVEKHTAPLTFMVVDTVNSHHGAHLLVRTGARSYDRYDIDKLYIVNGDLMSRDWFLNTKVAQIGYVQTDVSN